MQIRSSIIVALIAVILAHWPDQPALDAWSKGLTNGNGVPCCDDSEATRISDVDWQTTCEAGTGGCHYQVLLAGRWWNVPETAVVKGPNVSNTALVWPIFYYNDGKPELGVSSVSIRCFMPSTEI